MIEFDEDGKLIYLTNDNVSYVVISIKQGIENGIFFKDDFDCLRNGLTYKTSYYDVKERTEKNYEDGLKLDSAPLELSSHALADKRYSPIIIRNGDGSYESDFRYVSHEIYTGIKPLVAPLPHIYGENCETVEFLLKDAKTEL